MREFIVCKKLDQRCCSDFCNYNVDLPRNVSNEVFKALLNLSKNTNLMTQKSDKGNSVNH